MTSSIDFIPNSTMTPSVYFDKIMPLLTPAEWKVLSYLIRRTYGFRKDRDRVSLSQITDGIVRADGTPLDYGTGLSIPTARKALRGLLKYKLVSKLRANNKKNQGTEWGIQMDSSKVLWDGLWTRFWTRERQNQLAWGKNVPLSSQNEQPDAQAVVVGGVNNLHTPEGGKEFTGGLQILYRGSANSLQHSTERNSKPNREDGGAAAPDTLLDEMIDLEMIDLFLLEASAGVEPDTVPVDLHLHLPPPPLSGGDDVTWDSLQSATRPSEAAPTRTPKKRAAKPKQELPAQLSAFVKVWGVQPRKSQRSMLLEQVADTPDSIARWEEAMRAWARRGYSPYNIEGQIEWYAGKPRGKFVSANGHGHKITNGAPQRKKMTAEEFTALQSPRK